MGRDGLRLLALGGAAGALAELALGALRVAPPGGAPRWERLNHAGHTVSLLEGPAYVAAAAITALPSGPGPVVAALGGGALGALDDLAGDGRRKGLKGHLGALARGEVTTGAVKVAGLAATGLLSAALVDGRTSPRPALRHTVAGAGVIAGTANVVNLLDLRPGRALKAVTVLGLLLAGTRPADGGTRAGAAAAGAALGLLRPDLAGQTMLGDTGANSAGALLGAALVARAGTRRRWVALAILTALTLASERVSFTAVIESTPGLRELDAFGR